MAAQKPKLNFVEKIGSFEPREPILHSSHFSIPGEGYFMGKINPCEEIYQFAVKFIFAKNGFKPWLIAKRSKKRVAKLRGKILKICLFAYAKIFNRSVNNA
jgi:hypothetical protein